MNLFTLIQLQMVLLIFLSLGYFFAKRGLCAKQTQKQVTDWLINLILPCNIIGSFISQDVSRKTLEETFWVLVINTGIQIFLILFARFFFVKASDERRRVMEYGLINSNASFIALPVLTEIYGSLGAVYTATGVLPMRITMWTTGLRLFEGQGKGKSKKEQIISLLTHPCIVAVAIGFVAMVLPVEWPYFVTKSISSIGNCTAFIALFLVGAITAEMDLREVFTPTMLYFNLIRLVVLPGLVLGVLYFFHVPEIVAGVTIIMAGIPVGTTTGILAAKYDCDPEFASATILSSTVLALVTIPAFYYLVTILF